MVGLNAPLAGLPDNTKLFGVVDMLGGRATMQGFFERWPHENLMTAHKKLVMSNKVKYKVLHLRESSPKRKYRLGGKQTENSPEGKDLGMLVMKSST